MLREDRDHKQAIINGYLNLKMEQNMRLTAWGRSILADPRSHTPLIGTRREDLPDLRPIGRTGFNAPQIVPTDILFAAETARAYPVRDGFPALMWPDVLLRQGDDETVDLRDHRYAEVYAEMEFYNPVAYFHAKGVQEFRGFLNMKRLKDRQLPTDSFPEPVEA